MKRVLILHGTDNNSQGNWIPWLKLQLEKRGLEVWTPDLPESGKPNGERWTDYIFSEAKRMGFIFDKETVLVGHSSGAVEVMHLLNNLPVGQKVGGAYLVCVFHDDLDWEQLNELYSGVPIWDYEKIRTTAEKITIIHSDNDPYVDLAEAEYVAKKLEVRVLMISGQGHFNIGSRAKYKEFPKLMSLILMSENRFAELVEKLIDLGPELRLEVLGKTRKLKAMSHYITDNLGEDGEYLKAVFEDGSFLLILLKAEMLMFAEEIVDHIQSIKDEEIGTVEKLEYLGKKYVLDNKNDYQSVKEMIWGKLGAVEGEVRFSDYVPMEEQEREELLSLGWLVKNNARADINVLELKINEISWE